MRAVVRAPLLALFALAGSYVCCGGGALFFQPLTPHGVRRGTPALPKPVSAGLRVTPATAPARLQASPFGRTVQSEADGVKGVTGFLAGALAAGAATAAAGLRSRRRAVRGAAAVRSAVSMQVDWDAREAAEEEEKRRKHEALLKHLRTPIRQYEGGWADTALRSGGKDADRFGTGPDANKDKEGNLRAELQGDTSGEELIENAMHAALRGNERRKTKASASTTLPPEKQEQLVLPEESFKVTKMEMSQTDEDFVIECALGEEAELLIDIKPMFLMTTEYFYGFTADSDPKFSIDHSKSSVIEGEMASKSHAIGDDEDTENIEITIKFKPESAGEFEAYLGFMFPTEKAFSKFYKITGKSTDPEITRS